MKKHHFSIFLSLISIIGILIQNYRLAVIFNKSDDKTKALFGLIEIGQLDIKFYIGLILIISLYFSVVAIRKHENKLNSIFSICLCVISIILIFVRLWKLMI